MQPLLIVGPTASGKTSLSLWIASHLPKSIRGAGVDILVLDSKQVYIGEDIVTGKDLPEHSPARILGVNLVNPDEEWSVAQSLAYARHVIEEAKKKGRFLMIVGGTPQYILSLFEPADSFFVHPNPKVRAALEKLSVKELQAKLAVVDPTRLSGMNQSDIQNPRRLIRAIEVASATEKSAAEEPLLLISQCVWIGLEVQKDVLAARIHARVNERLAQGALDEYSRLKNEYPAWTKEARAAIGYAELAAYQAGTLDSEGLQAQWALHEIQYAKRQMTWWKREKQIRWFDAADPELQTAVFAVLKDCYNESL